MTERPWDKLNALIDFSGGFELWDVEMLVRFAGSERAGARIIERIEEQLAAHGIGHLPGKLPTDGTRAVLLYNREQPNLGFILRLIHELAVQDANELTNGSVHQLHSLLGGVSQAYQPRAAVEAIKRHGEIPKRPR